MPVPPWINFSDTAYSLFISLKLSRVNCGLEFCKPDKIRPNLFLPTLQHFLELATSTRRRGGRDEFHGGVMIIAAITRSQIIFLNSKFY